MELTFSDKVRKLLMTRKNFVMYMLDKNALEVKKAVDQAKARIDDAESSISTSIQQSRNTESEIVFLEQRALEIEIKLEGLTADYRKLANNPKNKNPDEERRLANILEELIEEQVRNEGKISSHKETIALHSEQIRNIRRSYNEMKSKAEELESRYQNIVTRKQLIESMAKTQVGLEMIESTSVNENAKISEAILGANERQQQAWQENREISSKSDTPTNQQVSARLNSILGEERKAIQ